MEMGVGAGGDVPKGRGRNYRNREVLRFGVEEAVLMAISKFWSTRKLRCL
jgi:hypothetical protein